ncbi:Maf-like protein [Clostridium chromiireducens]|uniref:dTTP/UTP pyrophosphatase n=1 Tax=Clostridium chromiireducens TaxID=225345 RepID=A0A964RPC7_9CLOT|nr:Maf-like protein [Clostridium chromiireducens]MVX65255.1 Maf-like protein [Clostridium chromiireducens]
MKIVLASASERRVELLNRLIKEFDIIVSDFDEDKVLFEGSIDRYVKEIALGKAMHVKKKLNEDAIIIAADTIVTLDNKLLGKPKDEEDAFNIIKSLQGRKHLVYSGIVVMNTAKNVIKEESLATEVTFSEISDNEILEYIKTGEPLDKAGAYGIQGIGGIFVEEIRGCYYNVVGLPLNKLKSMLKAVQ